MVNLHIFTDLDIVDLKFSLANLAFCVGFASLLNFNSLILLHSIRDLLLGVEWSPDPGGQLFNLKVLELTWVVGVEGLKFLLSTSILPGTLGISSYGLRDDYSRLSCLYLLLDLLHLLLRRALCLRRRGRFSYSSRNMRFDGWNRLVWWLITAHCYLVIIFYFIILTTVI